MSFSEADLDAINKAIASGTTRVKYQDKEVEYRSLADLERIRDTISDTLAGSEGGIKRPIGVYDSGL